MFTMNSAMKYNAVAKTGRLNAETRKIERSRRGSATFRSVRRKITNEAMKIAV